MYSGKSRLFIYCKMKNTIVLFGKQIPLYGICYYVGIIIAIFLALLFAKKRKVDFFDFFCCAIYTMIGAIIGAKLLFIIVSIREIIQLKLSLIDVVRGGFVFYGGLLGGILGVWIYGKQFRVNVRGYVDIFATVLPLGHAIGRVGCFFAGCCYGKQYNGIVSVVYETSSNFLTPLGVPLFPIQLLEAIFLIVLFIALFLLFCGGNGKDGNIAIIYLLSYAILRFVLEFFRGDIERGIILFSTSQWISLFFIVISIFRLFSRRIKKN